MCIPHHFTDTNLRFQLFAQMLLLVCIGVIFLQMYKSVGRDTITQNLIMSHSALCLDTRISGIALNTIDVSVLHFLDDTYMVGFSVLLARWLIWGVPVIEDDHSGYRCCGSISPLASLMFSFLLSVPCCTLPSTSCCGDISTVMTPIWWIT